MVAPGTCLPDGRNLPLDEVDKGSAELAAESSVTSSRAPEALCGPAVARHFAVVGGGIKWGFSPCTALGVSKWKDTRKARYLSFLARWYSFLLLSYGEFARFFLGEFL